MTSKIAQNASVSSEAKISENVSIWDFAQVRENAVVGENSIIGSYAYIDANVRIGKNCKIQNRALIYDPSIIHDGVFIGPGVILTNDKNPRSILDSGAIKSAKDWEKVGVEVLQGASIGSGAICVSPMHEEFLLFNSDNYPKLLAFINGRNFTSDVTTLKKSEYGFAEY